ncbi:Phosphate-regulating neutral endopeptidase [Aphelenchoides fujianensis]|nr:Phosphate-regulating neutral endopeptidase [Aphelenchoides fujianensis]
MDWRLFFFLFFLSVQRVDGQQPSKRTPSANLTKASRYLRESQDLSVNPCSNFFQFVCGRWKTNNPIPDGDPFVSRYTLLQQKVNRQLQKLFAHPPNGSDRTEAEAKVRFAFRACVNDFPKGVKDVAARLRKELAFLGGFPLIEPQSPNAFGFDLTEGLARLKQLRGFEALIKTDISRDLDNSTRFIAFFQVAPPHLKILDFYVEEKYAPVMVALRKDFERIARKLAADLRIPVDERRLTADVQKIVDFDRALGKLAAMKNTPEDGQEHELSHGWAQKTRMSKLSAYLPLIDWPRLMSSSWPKEMRAYLSGDPEIFVEHPEDFEALGRLLERTNPQVVLNYVLLMYFWRRVGTLGEKYSEFTPPSVEVNGRVIDEIHPSCQQKRPRETPPSLLDETAEICTANMAEFFPLVASNLWVREHFDPRVQRAVGRLVGDIRAAFREIIAENTWMDRQTKDYALEKASGLRFEEERPFLQLRKMRIHIGYAPNVMNDRLIGEEYSNVHFERSDVFDDVIRKIRAAEFQREVRRLLRAATPDDAAMSATEINAFYDMSNTITLPAAYLQPPFFDLNAPAVMNYGALGFTAAHEFSHGFDETGSLYNADGNLRKWWKEGSYNRFTNRTDCLVDQYSTFIDPQLHLHVNGQLTLGENIADVSGLKIAYRAFHNYLKRNPNSSHPLPQMEYRTPDQLFYISYAAAECTNDLPSELTKSLLSEAHTPEPFRVNGVVSNQPPAARAFQCPRGSKLNPNTKCGIW